MQYGLNLPNFNVLGSARTLANLAKDAEDAGWDGFFIWDHIDRPFHPENVDPWIALAAIAMNTSRIRFGAMVTPLPRRRPWKVARETVSLDHLSGGRLIFGAGLGSGRFTEWDHLGEETDPKARGKMLDEGLTVLNGLWRGKPFSFGGEHYRVKDALFLPRPVQQPRIPVWIGGVWPHKIPIRRAARWDGMFLVFDDMPYDELLAQFKEAVVYVRQQRTADTPFDISLAAFPTPGDDPICAAEMLAPFAAAGLTWWQEPLAPMRFGLDLEAPAWPLDAIRERIVQGPPR